MNQTVFEADHGVQIGKVAVLKEQHGIRWNPIHFLFWNNPFCLSFSNHHLLSRSEARSTIYPTLTRPGTWAT